MAEKGCYHKYESTVARTVGAAEVVIAIDSTRDGYSAPC